MVAVDLQGGAVHQLHIEDETSTRSAVRHTGEAVSADGAGLDAEDAGNELEEAQGTGEVLTGRDGSIGLDRDEDNVVERLLDVVVGGSGVVCEQDGGGDTACLAAGDALKIVEQSGHKLNIDSAGVSEAEQLLDRDSAILSDVVNVSVPSAGGLVGSPNVEKRIRYVGRDRRGRSIGRNCLHI
jgi:hypothetical protein